MIKKLIYIGIILLVLSLFYGLVRQLQTTLGAGKRLEDAKYEVEMAQKRNDELKKELMYVNSVDFIESVARDKLNKARPEETVIIIPEEELTKYLEKDKKPPEIKLPNWQRWLRLFWN